MTSKIRIKLGHMEVEYEGSEEFIKQELVGLVKTVSDLSKAHSPTSQPIADTQEVAPAAVPTQQSAIQMSANSIAAKLKCSTGPDLVLAAAASLTLVKNQDSFIRKQILEEMRSAASYYKASFGSNLSVHLIGQVKSNKLLERSTGQYALPADVRGELEKQLAQ